MLRLIHSFLLASCIASTLTGTACGRGEILIPPTRECDALNGSEGCRFVVARFIHRPRNAEDPDAVVVGNPQTSATRVQLHFIDGGTLLAAGDPVDLAGGTTERLMLFDGYHPETTSLRVESGAYVLVAEDPVSAQLFSPWTNRTANDASLMVPDGSLGRDYVVASFAPFVDPGHFDSPGVPSYFTVIAVQDDTRVEWTPPVATAGANGVPEVDAAGVGSTTLRAYERLRITARVPPDGSTSDVSGTVVLLNRPALVVGAVGCAYVPYGIGLCDHLQEILMPLERWSDEYVLAAPPARAHEPTLWRVFAGDEHVRITADPPVTGFPLTLSGRGSFAELLLPHDTRTVLRGDARFMPVQYLVGRDLADARGDPAMTQVIPIDAWRKDYLFGTGDGFEDYRIQVIRRIGSAPIFLDGEAVDSWQAVGDYEVAELPTPPGDHSALSEDPFALTQYGWSNGLGSLNRWAAYALPGGFAN
jgi:hypothetical protein